VTVELRRVSRPEDRTLRTGQVGCDGGPFFSPDRKWIVYPEYHPKTDQEIPDYKELLKQNLIPPTTLEIWIMKAGGSGKRN